MERFDFRARPGLPEPLVDELSAEVQFALRRAAALLGSAIRRSVSLQLAAAPQRADDNTPEAATLYRVECGHGHDALGVAVVPDALVIAAADVLQGGTGASLAERGATPLERSIVANRLTAVFEATGPVLPTHGVGTLRFVQVEAGWTPAPDLVRFRVALEIAAATGELCLDLPLRHPTGAPVAALPEPPPDLVVALSSVPVAVSVRFEPMMLPAGELEGLTVGDVIRLDHRAGAPLVGEVDGKPMLLVQPGRRGGRLAVEVRDVSLEGAT